MKKKTGLKIEKKKGIDGATYRVEICYDCGHYHVLDLFKEEKCNTCGNYKPVQTEKQKIAEEEMDKWFLTSDHPAAKDYRTYIEGIRKDLKNE
jgi:hypothetical protein